MKVRFNTLLYPINKLFILSLFVIFLASCRSEDGDWNDKIPTQIVGKGEIVDTAMVLVNANSNYPITPEMREKSHVIQNSLDNVFNLKVSFNKGVTWEDIDFQKYTLLGYYTSASGYNVVFDRFVTKNNTQKKVFYNITIYQKGSREAFFESMNWVLVPKIPTDYEIVFTIK